MIHREQDAKRQHLEADVCEENRKQAMQFVAEHRGPHRQLQDGVGDPERGLVINRHQPVFLPAGGATVDGML